MAYGAKILADSISPEGHRLTTFEITFPRLVLAEFNTHRVFSRNSASSRAIPVVKQLKRILEDPFVPLEFGTNQPGMQAGAALGGIKLQHARQAWRHARNEAVIQALKLISSPMCVEDGLAQQDKTGWQLSDLVTSVEEYLSQVANCPEQAYSDHLGVHKQLANRLLEPFMWHTVILTATEWSNFFALRAHKDAQT
jgi:thymidylate synthase ThyX